MIEIITHGILNMPESVSTQVLATVPASDYDNVVLHPLPFQHSSDHHARTCLTIIILYGT